MRIKNIKRFFPTRNKNKTDIIDFTTMEELNPDFSMEHMKNSYQSIPIPSELKNKVQVAIQKEKKESMKNRFIKYTKVAGISLAASMLTIIVLANSNTTISYAMEKLPIIGEITKVVNFRTYSDQTKDFQANIDVPQIEDDGNETIKDAVDIVNKSVEEYTDDLIAQYEEDMKASNGKGNYAMDTSYKVVNDTDSIFTLRIDTVVAMAGTNSYSKFYHINKKTGEVFDLKDVFAENTDYVTLLSDNMKKQMVENMAKDEMISYFYGLEDVGDLNFVAIKPDQNFYFSPDGELVLVFDKYEIAPGYMGEVEFTIPSDVINDVQLLTID
ncbi:MAG: RsiV family protein [Anaerocolumna sp.]